VNSSGFLCSQSRGTGTTRWEAGAHPGTGIMKRPAEEAEGELDEMFGMVRSGEPSKELALCRTFPSAPKARL